MVWLFWFANRIFQGEKKSLRIWASAIVTAYSFPWQLGKTNSKASKPPCVLKIGQRVRSIFLFSPLFYKYLFPSLSQGSVLLAKRLDGWMLGTVPPGRGKRPITRITWMQTRLESERTLMWNELRIGQGSRIIHLKHLCKSLSVLKEENKGTLTWPPGQSEQNPYVWRGLATHLWKKVYLFQYRFYLIMFLNFL